MAKKTWVNIAGTWRNAKNVWVNVNGVWKEKVIPKGNIAGNWRDFIQYMQELYKNGDFTIPFSQAYNSSSFNTLTKNNSNFVMHLQAHNSTVQTFIYSTVNSIDLTNYKTLTLNLSIPKLANVGSVRQGGISVGISASKPISPSPPYVAQSSVNFNESALSETLTIDVSALSGMHYLYIKGHYNSYANFADITMSNFILQ